MNLCLIWQILVFSCDHKSSRCEALTRKNPGPGSVLCDPYSLCLCVLGHIGVPSNTQLCLHFQDNNCPFLFSFSLMFQLQFSIGRRTKTGSKLTALTLVFLWFCMKRLGVALVMMGLDANKLSSVESHFAIIFIPEQPFLFSMKHELINSWHNYFPSQMNFVAWQYN